MTNPVFHIDTGAGPGAEATDWTRLYARICELALARASSLAAQNADDEAGEFDRGARALRTLMSAADIARRMKDQDAREKDLNARQTTPAVSDERIRALRANVERQIERIEREDREAGEGGDGQ